MNEARNYVDRNTPGNVANENDDFVQECVDTCCFPCLAVDVIVIGTCKLIWAIIRFPFYCCLECAVCMTNKK